MALLSFMGSIIIHVLKILLCFFCICLHKPDFAGFSQGFHWLFMAFSRFFHGVTIFANLEVAPSIFQAIGYLWGWDLARLNLTKIRLQK